MINISKEWLKNELKNLEAQQKQALARLNYVSGMKAALEQQLAYLNGQEAAGEEEGEEEVVLANGDLAEGQPESDEEEAHE